MACRDTGCSHRCSYGSDQAIRGIGIARHTPQGITGRQGPSQTVISSQDTFTLAFLVFRIPRNSNLLHHTSCGIANILGSNKRFCQRRTRRIVIFQNRVRFLYLPGQAAPCIIFIPRGNSIDIDFFQRVPAAIPDSGTASTIGMECQNHFSCFIQLVLLHPKDSKFSPVWA